MAERTSDHKQLIFTTFDPALGRGRELARFDSNPTPDAEYAWDLSPDGTRIAILKRSETTIHVLSLNRQASKQIFGKGWGGLQSVDLGGRWKQPVCLERHGGRISTVARGPKGQRPTLVDAQRNS